MWFAKKKKLIGRKGWADICWYFYKKYAKYHNLLKPWVRIKKKTNERRDNVTVYGREVIILSFQKVTKVQLTS